ncbi:MAG: hypothetical protein NVS9B4_09490 [Candidatus Acidiferrum sp.]
MRRIFSSAFIATATGLALRLFFVFRYPGGSGDTALYEQIAANWLKLGAYAVNVDGAMISTDVRMPGYPGFLAIVYALTGRTGESARLGIMLAQVGVDLATGFAIAGLAAVLASLAFDRVGSAYIFERALWLAMLCPFTGNYTAVLLTEVFAVFFTAAATLFLCWLVAKAGGSATKLRGWPTLTEPWLAGLGSLCAGIGTLFRPESPLILVAGWLSLLIVLVYRREKFKLARLTLVMAVFFALPLLPWAMRNVIVLHEVQILTPKSVNLPGELVPRGFMAWEKTWLYRMRDCYLSAWKLNEEAIYINDLPATAFDTVEERQRVEELLARYNTNLTLTREEDASFLQLANERKARHPLRVNLLLPLARATTMWFTPRIELLPFSGKVFPLKQSWQEDPVDQGVTVGFFLLNIVYAVLAISGARLLWRGNVAVRPIVGFLVVFILLRTAFLTTLETPEPRYVLECFPAVLALGAQVWCGRRRRLGLLKSDPAVTPAECT